jgi:hypothetical protein
VSRYRSFVKRSAPWISLRVDAQELQLKIPFQEGRKRFHTNARIQSGRRDFDKMGNPAKTMALISFVHIPCYRSFGAQQSGGATRYGNGLLLIKFRELLEIRHLRAIS